MRKIQFNIEYYNSHPNCKVVTRNDRNVRVLCTDAYSCYCVVSLLENDGRSTLSSTKDGLMYTDGSISDYDLFIEINSNHIYVIKITDSTNFITLGGCYETLEDARNELKRIQSIYSNTYKLNIHCIDMETETITEVYV